MLMPKRKWKDVKNYEGLHQVSNLGEVRSLNYHKMKITRKMKLFKGKDGYLRINLTDGKKKKSYLVHRLVAEAFIPNPNKYLEINHKDETRDNNMVLNLEWCDRSYNNNYGTKIDRQREKISGSNNHNYNKRRGQSHLSKKVICITTGEVFECILDASEKYNIHHSNIIRCCQGVLKTSGTDPISGKRLRWAYYDFMCSEYENMQQVTN